MKVSYYVDGVSQLQTSIKLLNIDVRKRVATENERTGGRVVRNAKSRVAHRTGELADTIRYEAEPGTDGLVGFARAGYGSLKRRTRQKPGIRYGKKGKRKRLVQVGPVEPGIYAMVHEFGDPKRNKPARPYMFPAVEAERAGHRERVAAALQGAVDVANQRAT